MKYINKINSKSLHTDRALQTWKTSYCHQGRTLEEICNDMTVPTNKIWKQLPNPIKILLRETLHEEQGGICCYCGCELRKRKMERIIEHFKVKSQDRWNRMFDYNNLLLSCHGNKFKWHKTTRTDTWDNLAAKYETSVQVLKELNSDLESPIEDEKIKIGYIEGTQNHHCDNFRGNSPIPNTINPVSLPNCMDKFAYKIKKNNTTDKILVGTVTGNDADAITTVTVLNLNASILMDNRKAVVEDAKILLEEISEEADASKQPIEVIAQQKLDGISHLYVVYRAYLKNHIPNLI